MSNLIFDIDVFEWMIYDEIDGIKICHTTLRLEDYNKYETNS